MTTNNSTSKSLGQYVRDIFDLNRDGKVTLKEFFSTLIPNQAVAISLLVTDLLAALGEYRVWQVGMHISQNDPWTAAGFVAISLVPFYLAQVLWLYPLATGWQQFIAVVMGLTSLFTSMQFGFADLTQTYNVEVISAWVTRLWFFYIVLLLLYVLQDKNFKLMRARITARANATHQNNMNATMNDILSSLRESLEAERKLREEFGDEAVDAHLQMLRAVKNGANGQKALPNPQKPPQP